MTTYIVRRNDEINVVSTAAMRDNDIIIIHGNSSVFITSRRITEQDNIKIKGRVKRFLQRLSHCRLPRMPFDSHGVYVDTAHDPKGLIGDLFDP